MVQATATHKRGTIVLFGDSITEQSLSAQGGWGTRLAEHYVRVPAHLARVINRGSAVSSLRCAATAPDVSRALMTRTSLSLRLSALSASVKTGTSRGCLESRLLGIQHEVGPVRTSARHRHLGWCRSEARPRHHLLRCQRCKLAGPKRSATRTRCRISGKSAAYGWPHSHCGSGCARGHHHAPTGGACTKTRVSKTAVSKKPIR